MELKGMDDIRERMERRSGELGAAGQRVAAVIRNRPTAVLAASAAEIAALARTSDATVIRTVQLLGYTGLPGLKHALAASIEGRLTLADNMRRTLSHLDGGHISAVQAVLDAQDEVLETLRAQPFQEHLARGLAMLHAAERIVIFGIGPSAHLARYTATLLTRSGRKTFCLDAAGISLADQLLSLQDGDAILALTYGKPYHEIVAVIREARLLGLSTVVITDSSSNRIGRDAGAAIILPRGRQGHIALHGGTLIALEMIVLALSAGQQEHTLGSLRRLSRLRAEVTDQHDGRKPAGED